MANLLQVSSAFGRAMENLDRLDMTRRLYKVLSAENHGLNTLEMDAAISACSEGYSFPTNLDTDPPIDGLAPETQAALFRRALSIGMTITEFNASLDAQVVRQKF
jgi:ectoine hydroxylase-related dioxygenase (phytanoyl-CoA dioxygenase family)